MEWGWFPQLSWFSLFQVGFYALGEAAQNFFALFSESKNRGVCWKMKVDLLNISFAKQIFPRLSKILNFKQLLKTGILLCSSNFSQTASTQQRPTKSLVSRLNPSSSSKPLTKTNPLPILLPNFTNPQFLLGLRLARWGQRLSDGEGLRILHRNNDSKRKMGTEWNSNHFTSTLASVPTFFVRSTTPLDWHSRGDEFRSKFASVTFWRDVRKSCSLTFVQF